MPVSHALVIGPAPATDAEHNAHLAALVAASGHWWFGRR